MGIGDKRHKVLLSAYACEPNKGSEPGVGWNWAKHLAEKYEIYVITRKNNQTNIENYLTNNPVDHLHFIYYDCSRVAKQIKKMPNGIFWYYRHWQKKIFPIVKKIIRDKHIELIHHITFNEFRIPGQLYKLELPFIWGPIGGGQFYNSVFQEAYFRKQDIVKELFRNWINRFYLLYSFDIKNAVKKASAILIADPSTEKIMPNNRPYIRLLETAYNVDRNPVKQYSAKKTGEKLQLLWVGGIWPRKGLKLLIDALGKSDFRNFNLKIIGDGKDKKPCKRLVHFYGLDDYVCFCGKMSYEEVNRQYDHADLFIFTSLRDTSGNVVLEAMSHGLPVITLDHHGAGKIVTNETGTKITTKNYPDILREMVKSIRYYADAPYEIEKKGRAARKRIEEIYSWEHNVKEMCKIYDGVLEGIKDELI